MGTLGYKGMPGDNRDLGVTLTLGMGDGDPRVTRTPGQGGMLGVEEGMGTPGVMGTLRDRGDRPTPPRRARCRCGSMSSPPPWGAPAPLSTSPPPNPRGERPAGPCGWDRDIPGW